PDRQRDLGRRAGRRPAAATVAGGRPRALLRPRLWSGGDRHTNLGEGGRLALRLRRPRHAGGNRGRRVRAVARPPSRHRAGVPGAARRLIERSPATAGAMVARKRRTDLTPSKNPGASMPGTGG